MRRRFHISIVEVFFVAAILGAEFAFLTPAVNAERYARGEPQIFTGFRPFEANNGWSQTQKVLFIPAFATVVALAAITVIAIVRQLLPEPLRDRIVWFPDKAGSRFPSRLKWGLEVALFLLLAAFLVTLLLIAPPLLK
jgi:hypothetical protein